MKIKFISSILILSIALSQCVFAEAENGLESAISTAKEKLEIPESYTHFYSQIEQDNNTLGYYLSWSGDGSDKEKGGSATAKVDEIGRIIYYSQYEYGSFEGDYKLSELDYNGAVAIANDYINKICPEFAQSVQAENINNYIERNYNSYRIIYYRYENGVPYYNNYITIAISPLTKKLTELDVKWDDIEKFPSPQGSLAMSRANELFKDKIGISLGYYYNSDGVTLYYSAKNNGGRYINAYTGEITETNISGGHFITASSEYALNYNGEYTVDEDINLIPLEQLEASARKQLDIEDYYALGTTQLLKEENGNYYYNLMFVRKDKPSKNVAINAKTKEIITYFNYNDHINNRIISEEIAFKNAKDFIEKLSPKRYKSCSQSMNVVKSEYESNYTFIFPRLVNGLEYMNDGISVTVSSITGDIITYILDWSKEIFPTASNIVTKDIAYNEIFNRAGMELQYVATAKKGILYPQNAKDIDIKLVYNFVNKKPLYVKAETGKLCDINGIDYIGDLDSNYTDISGHQSQKYIDTLKACGIITESEKFNPDVNITQYDYLLWIYNAINQYPVYDANNLYNGLIYGKNVLTEQERNENTEIIFEDAIKYLIRLLGYTDVAELKDTYKTGFVDEGAISPDLIGYAAIAKGLGIIKGNAFTPKSKVTRATAAEMIYNLLTN